LIREHVSSSMLDVRLMARPAITLYHVATRAFRTRYSNHE
jgi:hypothetical protein